jgi:hypothetical protein
MDFLLENRFLPISSGVPQTEGAAHRPEDFQVDKNLLLGIDLRVFLLDILIFYQL